MKRLLLLTTCVLWTWPALAVDQLVSPEQRRQAEEIFQRWTDALNKGDTTAAQQLAGANSINIDPYGISRGQTGSQASIDRFHKFGGTIQARIEEIMPIGSNQMLVVGSYTAKFSNNPGTQQVQGNVLQLYEQDGPNRWQIRASAAARMAQPAQ